MAGPRETFWAQADHKGRVLGRVAGRLDGVEVGLQGGDRRPQAGISAAS